MITTMVQFVLPERLSPERARELFLQSAPKFRTLDGLIRKYYVLSDDGSAAGGVYLWESRQAAETAFSEAWARTIRDKYGSDPLVTYFQTPVVVDNQSGAVVRD